MNTNITVTVASCTGMGTTTVAELITSILEQHGFDVSHDPGPEGPRKSNYIAQIAKEGIVKERSKIVVNEKHFTRQECHPEL